MSQKFEKLKTLLKELFQLDQPDLDFGLYRIMHAKSAEVTQFLDKDLLPQVQQAFSLYKTADKAELEKELAKTIEQAQSLGAVPDSLPKVKELRAKLANDAVDIGTLENEVYDHLFSFFRRYYSEGDFLAKRVYRPGVYAIPYEGEEVKLHWANHDQFYIKTSEYLRDYAFRLKPDNAAKPMRVHFRLVDATEGEHGNVKAANDKDRVFILAYDEFIAQEGDELIFRFVYRPATLTDWPETEREGKKKPPGQKDLTALAVNRILAITDATFTPWITELSKPHVNLNGTAPGYSRIEGHLKRYTARNTFDYFIHKDLGGFLRRELDFYVKNEVMHLDDIESDTAPRVEQYLSKIRVIRRIAGKVIDFIAQLEDFQKKLWLKKKFVVETTYCITLDRIPEEFYQEIAANDAQREEWVHLFAINEIEGDLIAPVYSKPLTVAFLKANQHLPIDTGNFEPEFASKLLSRLDNLEQSVPSLVVHADNFHGLSLIGRRYASKIRCAYLDPPYNTNVSAIPYKNNYKHSSWLTMMMDRMYLVRETLTEASGCYVSIDKNERSSLEAALNYTFSGDNKIEELIWVQNTNDGRATTFSTNHEYVLVYSKNKTAVEADFSMFREPKPGYEEVCALIAELGPDYPTITEVEEKLSKFYSEAKLRYRRQIEQEGLDWEEEKRNDPWKGIYQYRFAEYRSADGVFVPFENARKLGAKLRIYRESDWTIMESDRKQSLSTKDPNDPNFRYYQPIHPLTGKPVAMPSRGWKGTKSVDPKHPDRNSWDSLIADNRIAFGPDETKVPQQKRFLHEVETNVAKSIIVDYSDGERETSALFGRTGVFLAPKHTNFVKRFVLQATQKTDYVIDIFGGSGSTAHAVLKANRADGGWRNFIIMEANSYIDEIVIPRIKKGIYSDVWSQGKPLSRNSGSSHAFKIVRLESYEDAINNLIPRRSIQQDDLLASPDAQGPDRLKEQYMLRYMLDVETRGSQSLLNVKAFADPTAYKLKVKRPGSDESREVNVDLLETFNWLIGLTVQGIAMPQTFKADFERDTEGRLNIKGRPRQDPAGPWWFRTVTGTTPDGRRALIIWRKLTGNPEQDNLMLDTWFTRAGYSAKDSEFGLIYVNGDNNLENLKAADDAWKVRLIEEDFHRLMFDREGL